MSTYAYDHNIQSSTKQKGVRHTNNRNGCHWGAVYLSAVKIAGKRAIACSGAFSLPVVDTWVAYRQNGMHSTVHGISPRIYMETLIPGSCQ